MVRKETTYGSRFGPKEVEKLVNAMAKFLREDGRSPEDLWLCAAATHAMNLHNACKGVGITLDFTALTDENVPCAIRFSHRQLLTEGLARRERYEILARRVAAYALFRAHNELRDRGIEAQLVCSEPSMKLTAQAADGRTHAFDFLGGMVFPTRCFASVDPSDGFLMNNVIRPFQKKVDEEFMIPLLESFDHGDEMLMRT